MKRNIRTLGSYKLIYTFSIVTLLTTGCASQSGSGSVGPSHAATTATADTLNGPGTPTPGKKKIKVAILLDTSGSMDGLIDQARSQLWKIINELAKAKCDNERPELEIALYEYGNDNLSGKEGYIRQISQFTRDLDLISEKLFSLTTNGGSEYCGEVIATSLKQLTWSDPGNDLQMIFIAGNEPFTQGPVSYAKACKDAFKKDVVVNSIFCGDFNEGISTSWKDGADCTGGYYMSIEQDRKTVYIESPYDKDIATLNESLNGTYVTYGAMGYKSKEKQIIQDKNAAVYGNGNNVSRIVSKSSHFYKNSTWDLVDANDDKTVDFTKLKDEDLPKEMQGKTIEEKKKYIEEKKAERTKINQKIGELNKQRLEYIAQKESEMGIDQSKTLDVAMITAIKSKATAKNFTFEK